MRVNRKAYTEVLDLATHVNLSLTFWPAQEAILLDACPASHVNEILPANHIVHEPQPKGSHVRRARHRPARGAPVSGLKKTNFKPYAISCEAIEPAEDTWLSQSAWLPTRAVQACEGLAAHAGQATQVGRATFIGVTLNSCIVYWYRVKHTPHDEPCARWYRTIIDCRD